MPPPGSRCPIAPDVGEWGSVSPCSTGRKLIDMPQRPLARPGDSAGRHQSEGLNRTHSLRCRSSAAAADPWKYRRFCRYGAARTRGGHTVFTLDQVVPWGRSFDEYRLMFALSENDLQLRILGGQAGRHSGPHGQRVGRGFWLSGRRWLPLFKRGRQRSRSTPPRSLP